MVFQEFRRLISSTEVHPSWSPMPLGRALSLSAHTLLTRLTLVQFKDLLDAVEHELVVQESLQTFEFGKGVKPNTPHELFLTEFRSHTNNLNRSICLTRWNSYDRITSLLGMKSVSGIGIPFADLVALMHGEIDVRTPDATVESAEALIEEQLILIEADSWTASPKLPEHFLVIDFIAVLGKEFPNYDWKALSRLAAMVIAGALTKSDLQALKEALEITYESALSQCYSLNVGILFGKKIGPSRYSVDPRAETMAAEFLGEFLSYRAYDPTQLLVVLKWWGSDEVHHCPEMLASLKKLSAVISDKEKDANDFIPILWEIARASWGA